MTSTSATDPARPVRLPRRSRQGIVLGMDAWQIACITIAAATMLIGINRFGPAGLLIAAPAYLPFGVLALVQLQGMSAPRLFALWLSKQARHVAGATTQQYRPEQPVKEGTLNLPGTRASVQIWDVEGMASAYSPHERTVSITAELEVQGFLMKDIPDRRDLAQQWANVLAAFTQRPGVKRVTLQERTTPTTIRAARAHLNDITARLHDAPAADVADNYRRVMDTSERFAVAHRNFLTLTLDLPALSGQLKALGGGAESVQRLAAIEAQNITDALRTARITVRRWLSPRDLAALSRTAFDPEFLSTVQNRDPEHEGVALSAIGPMYLEEPRGKNGIVITDSGVHTTMWIHEWPRSDAPIGFIAPLVFARHPVTGEAVTHILSIVLTPVPVEKALRRIREEKKVWRGNQKMRARRNADGSAADEADWLALERQEEELVAGHGEFRYGAYLTITAPDEEQLEQSVAGARNALSQVGMEAQILYCQQAEALLVNALPLGMGMK